MNARLSMAAEDARDAIRAHPNCFEGHAALMACLLTGTGDLMGAFETWAEAQDIVPHDLDGHFLKLALHLLFVEVVEHSVEDAHGVQLRLVHTSTVKGVVRLLDGYPRIALEEFAKAERPLQGKIGTALALFRLHDTEGAIKALTDAQTTLLGMEGLRRLKTDVRAMLEALGSQAV